MLELFIPRSEMPLDSDPLSIVAGGLVAICLTASATVWSLALARRRQGRPLLAASDEPRPGYPRFVVAVVLLWLVFEASTRLLPAREQRQLELSDVQAGTLLSVVLWMLLLAFLCEGVFSRLSEFGLRLSCLGPQLRDGLLGFCLAVLPVFAVRMLTVPADDPEVQHAFLKLLRDEPKLSVIVWLAVAAVIVAPLFEELLYRVVLQGWLETKLGPQPAIGIASVVFAAVHGLPDSLALLPLSFVLGYVYSRRHSYVAVVALHMLFNTTNLTLAILSLAGAP